ncbi:MAG: ABC transporter [Bacteroidetes bacterium]|nr:MAG: ABC transporter [Bacteroidota bacterium]PTM15138.1 MAG: ABC transporter [Bacteroidota bacterium]
MNWSVLLSISRIHILSRIKQSVIAGLGVTFGIATFIVLVSFMTGLNGLLDGLILNRTPHVHIYNEILPSKQQPLDLYSAAENSLSFVHSVKPKSTAARIHNALPLLKILQGNPQVLGVTPQVTAQAFYTAGTIELNGIIHGINIQEESRLFKLDDYVMEGNILDLENNNNTIIIGAGVAQKLSAGIDDRIQLVTAKGNVVPLKIVGIYQSGLADIDNVQSYTNLKTAQRIIGEGDNFITDINIKLHHMEDALPFARNMEKLYGVTAVDIGTANAQFETGTTVRNIITYAVSITLLIVAGFGIYNILNMFIYEKMNDIAILKATGFSGRDVKFIFISQALIIGLVGGTLGLLLGYSISTLISHLPFETEALPTIKTYPVNFNPAYYFIGVVFALSATFFAGYLPARKAEQIDPVDIIRGQ